MKRILIALLFVLVWVAPSYADIKVVCGTPTTASGAYADGDTVGTLMTFSGAAGSESKAGVVASAWITDKAAQSANLKLVLFGSSVTLSDDNAAFAVSDADAAKIATAPIDIATHEVTANNSWNYSGSISKVFRVDTHDLYGAVVADGTPTYASATDLTVCVAVILD